MSTDHLTNAAGRLYLLLEFSKNHAPRGPKASAVAATRLWADYVHAPGDDDPRFYAMLTDVLQMPAAARDAVATLTSLPVPQSEFLEPIARIEHQMFSSVGRRVHAAGFADAIAPTDIAQLKMASFFLMRGALGSEATKDTLERVVGLANEIRDLVLADDEIDATLRLLMLRLVDRVRISVDRYKIGGVDAVATDVDQLVGAGLRASLISEKPNRNLGSKLKEIATAVILLGGAVAAPGQIGESVMSYIDALQEANSTSIEAPGTESGHSVS